MPQKAAVRRQRYRMFRAAGLCGNCGKARQTEHSLCNRCKQTSDEASTRWKARNPGNDRTKALRRKYGLTPVEVERMLAAQSGRCAICGTDRPVRGGWQVDHCHTSKKVRALLCRLCNVGLGSFQDDPELLERAAAYLRKHKLTLVG